MFDVFIGPKNSKEKQQVTITMKSSGNEYHLHMKSNDVHDFSLGMNIIEEENLRTIFESDKLDLSIKDQI